MLASEEKLWAKELYVTAKYNPHFADLQNCGKLSTRFNLPQRVILNYFDRWQKIYRAKYNHKVFLDHFYSYWQTTKIQIHILDSSLTTLVHIDICSLYRCISDCSHLTLVCPLLRSIYSAEYYRSDIINYRSWKKWKRTISTRMRVHYLPQSPPPDCRK